MSITEIAKKLAMLDLSPLVPRRLQKKAKAVGMAILSVVAVAVQLAVIDAGTGALITTVVLGALGTVGVHQTANSKK